MGELLLLRFNDSLLFCMLADLLEQLSRASKSNPFEEEWTSLLESMGTRLNRFS